jgi:hypothetical protein
MKLDKVVQYKAKSKHLDLKFILYKIRILRLVNFFQK